MAKIKKLQAFPKRRLPKNPPQRKGILVHIEDHQKAFPIEERLIRSVAEHLFFFLKIQKRSVSIYFVTKQKGARLHREFFNDPAPTDCMSFPMEGSHLGEIVICPFMALSYPDPLSEILLYLIHGMLHLIGYDDSEEKDIQKMRLKEQECLQYISKLAI